jgi:hypothetical protein
MEPRQITFVTFATFCSNPRLLAACRADFTHLRPDERRSVKPVQPSRTQSHSVRTAGNAREIESWLDGVSPDRRCDKSQFNSPNRTLSQFIFLADGREGGCGLR